jgi:hypothetical protein
VSSAYIKIEIKKIDSISNKKEKLFLGFYEYWSEEEGDD